jgi:hypothetical protein
MRDDESARTSDNMPWHKFGTRFVQHRSIEESMHLAGLDWRVSTRTDLRESCVLVREDILSDGGIEILGNVRPGFVPLQNNDAFAFLTPILERGAFVVDSAGSCAKGEWVWIMLRSPHDQEIAQGEPIRPFLLFGHTPRTAQYRLAYVLVRLTNLSVLIEEAFHNPEPLVTTPNTRPRRFKDSDQAALNQIDRHLKALRNKFVEMTQTALSEVHAEAYFAAISELTVQKPLSANRNNTFEANETAAFRTACIDLFREGGQSQRSGGRGTLWSAYCSVVEYVDGEISGLDEWEYLRELWFSSAKGCALRIALKKLEEASD